MESVHELRKRLTTETSALSAAQRDSSLTEALLYILERDPSAVRRKNAAFVFGKTREVRAVAPLCRALRREETIVREYAADALGEIGDGEAVRPLIHALSDATTIVRVCARRALVKIGKPAVKPLIEELWDCPLDRREGVHLALTEIGVPTVASLLIAIDCAGTKTRRDAQTILHRIAPGGAMKTLPLSVLKDELLTPKEKRHTLELLLPKLAYPDVVTYCSVYRHEKSVAIAEGARSVLHVMEGESLLRPADPNRLRQPRELLRSLGRVLPENPDELLRAQQ